MSSRTIQGPCIWLTGRPASGKSSIATALAASLNAPVTLLDGDLTRPLLATDLGFSLTDRVEHARRVATLARQRCEQGHIVLCALISPTPTSRAIARHILAPVPFIECHVDCSLHTCKARDPKGLYARASRGDIDDFTGVSSPYIPPEHPDLVLWTAPPDYLPTHAADDILAHLLALGLIAPDDLSHPR